MLNRIITVILMVVILSAGLGGAAYASYKGYGLSTSETQSARTGSVRGIFIIGGGPSIGGK